MKHEKTNKLNGGRMQRPILVTSNGVNFVFNLEESSVLHCQIEPRKLRRELGLDTYSVPNII
jgi:hypothetical protein